MFLLKTGSRVELPSIVGLRVRLGCSTGAKRLILVYARKSMFSRGKGSVSASLINNALGRKRVRRFLSSGQAKALPII